MLFPLNLLLTGIVVVLAWILNLSTICAMRSLNSSTRIVYGFLSSLCVSNLFQATLNFPPSIISNILVSRPLQHILCVSWTYLDTLLCNVTILHLLGSSLDSYLRLRHQSRYVASTKQVMTCLKLSAPWTLSFIQSTAFMAIAQINESSLEDGICIISDPNFLILRSVMCFGVPISGSAILVFLSAKSLSYIEPQVKSLKTANDQNTECHYESFQLLQSNTLPVIIRDETQETIARSIASNESTTIIPQQSFDNTLSYYQHQCPRHGLLALPINNTMPLVQFTDPTPINQLQETSCRCCPSQNLNPDYCNLRYVCPSSSSQHCPDLIPTQQTESPSEYITNPSSLINSSIFNLHYSKSSGNISERVTKGCNLPSSQSLDIQKIYSHRYFEEMQPTKVSGNSANFVKRHVIKSQERITVAINLILCIFTILLWGPFIIGSLIQGVCKPPYCILPISNARINEFKWLSYILCMLYPIIFLLIDSEIRTIIKSSISCL